MNPYLSDIINKFNTTPFLFAGSGLTRRYYNLPDWKSLLEVFASKVSDDEFAYIAYENKARSIGTEAGIYPKIAELIERDFNELWFKKPEIRRVNDRYLKSIKAGVSPFKAEIAMFIEENSKISEKYEKEVNKLKEISEKSITGIITTNYDMFFEQHLDQYSTYVGQEELVFSPIQGIAEIYKIHGSIEQPASIVINEEDYIKFDKGSPYLAAKLMTIFMEYPIIFIGYSITDSNIQKILSALVNCLSENNMGILRKRFVFIDYQEGHKDVTIAPHTIIIDGRVIEMTKVTLDNFMPLYEELANKQAKIPVKLLRMFKQELYKFTIENRPTANLRVASIDDRRVGDEDLVLAIGKASDFGLKGLKGLSSSEWYKNIVIDSLEFTADDLLDYAYPALNRQNSNTLPIFKYLSLAKNNHTDCILKAKEVNFDTIISQSFKNNRGCLNRYTSVQDIWKNEKSLEKATRLLAHLEETQINIDDLEEVLKQIFDKHSNILDDGTQVERTNIRRLIRVYDWMKYGVKVKESFD